MLAFLNTVPGSFMKVLLATVLTVALADIVATGSFDALANWQTWLIAGLAAAVPVLINWLNPTDPRYGRTGEG